MKVSASAPSFACQPLRLGQLVLRAPRQRQPRSRAAERQRDCPPDATAGAGNDCDFALQKSVRHRHCARDVSHWPQHLAEQHPALAVEARELQLLERIEVGRTGVDLDPGQQHRQLEILEAGGLPHHVLARQLVAALLEHLHQGLRGTVAIHVEDIGEVALADSTSSSSRPSPEPLVLLTTADRSGSLRYEAVISPIGLFQPGRLQHRADRLRDVVHERAAAFQPMSIASCGSPAPRTSAWRR